MDNIGSEGRGTHPLTSEPSDKTHRCPGDGLWARPNWAAIALGGVAILALILYTWALSRNGMANSYYAAAVKSATVSWKAFFFGSLDPGSFITVDKPPVSLWVQALFARTFGFSSWSILLPQALAGVASVLILHRLVRRWAGEVPALFSALGFALTPVAVLLFRYNNPDALLTLLLLAAAWAFWSALESGSTWKLTAGGALLGFAFLTKMLEAVIVVPAFVAVYLACGPRRLGHRLFQVFAAFAAFVVLAGWWVAIVELWPETTRPYIGGSTGNSVIELIFSRSGGFLCAATGAANLSGPPGWLRIFNTRLGGQISWLLPMALLGLAAGLWITRRAPRTDKRRAGYFFWGLWTLVMIAVFSRTSGTFHSYYVVIMAPGISALAGAGSMDLWQLSSRHGWLSCLLPASIAGTAIWAAHLVGRISGYAPGLAGAIVAAGFLAALMSWLVLARLVTSRALTYPIVIVAAASLLAGPFAYSLSTVGRAVTGNQAAAGPPSERTQTDTRDAWGEGGSDAGGGSAEISVDSSLLAFLERNRGAAKYLVAVEGSAAAVPIILATGEPVVTIGGYRERDPTPSAVELADMVAAGELHFALISGGQSQSSTSSRPEQSAGSASSDDPTGSMSSDGADGSVTEWIITNGAVVDPSAYGGSSSDVTLYHLG